MKKMDPQHYRRSDPDYKERSTVSREAYIAATVAFASLRLFSSVERRGPLVIREQIARGAGQSDWYMASTADELAVCCSCFGGGSLIHVIQEKRFTKVKRAGLDWGSIEHLTSHKNDLWVGRLRDDDVRIEMRSIETESDFQHDTEDWNREDIVIYGCYEVPLATSDLYEIKLPDIDGVTRQHPY